MHRRFTTLAVLSLASGVFAQTRPHPYDLQHVKWHIVLDEANKALSGETTNRIKPNKGVREVWFDRGELNVSAAYVGQTKVPFRLVGQKVYVTLPRTSSTSVDVRFKYSGRPRAGLYFVPANRAFPAKTSSIYTQGEMEDNRFWMVTYDYPDDKATSEGIIEVPKGYFALSNGKLLSTKTVGNRSVFHWKMDQPHVTYLIAFVAGQYEKGHEAWDALAVDWYVPKGLKAMGESSFARTADMVRFFSELTGFKYPYAKFSQAVVPDYMFGGMENISMVTNTINTLHPPSAKPLASSEGLVLHELAHQWFGDTVTTNGWADAWINEGWASFLPAFYVRQKQHPTGWSGDDEFSLYRYDTFNGGLGAHKAKPFRGVVFTEYKDPLDMFDGFIYAGGASRMFMLMNMLGEKQFWAATKQYLNERKYTSFDTRAFFNTWSRATGRNLTGFMNQWFYRAAAPNLTAGWEGNEVVITQPLPHFDLQVPVWVLMGSEWIKKSVHLTGGEARIDFTGAAGKPFLVDPEVWLMTDITYKNELNFADRLALLTALPTAGGKARVLDQLLRGRSAEESLQVIKSLDQAPLITRYVSSVESGQAGEETVNLLVNLLRNSDRTIANAAAAKLGQVSSQPDRVVAALTDLYRSDSNVLIQQTAYRSLLEITKADDLARQGWTKPSYNDGFRQIALDWWSRNNRDVARERALEAIRTGLPEPTRVNAIRLLGSLKDKAGENSAYSTLVGLLREESFGARNTAISALAEYGNKDAVDWLKPFLTHPLVFFRQTATRSIDRLQRS